MTHYIVVPEKKTSLNHLTLGSWISCDLEWIGNATNREYEISSGPQSKENGSGTSEGPSMEVIVTLAFENSSGNTGVIDISDFPESQYPNPRQAFLITIKETLMHYSYCFAWGSKATRHKNKETGKIEGINGDLVVLDKNFRINNIPSIIRYDNFSGRPYIWTTCNSNPNSETTTPTIALTTGQVVDIDLLQVYAKPLVRTTIFKNRYKGLHLDEVATSLLGCGKLDNRSGASIKVMSIEERKRYCKNDAHLVAELVRIRNGDILKMMKVMAYHTKLRMEDVCHKGMSGIWAKILNDEIGRKIRTVGYDNIPYVLRKLYSTSRYEDARRQHPSIDFIDDECDGDEEEEPGMEEFADEHNKLTNSYSHENESNACYLPHQFSADSVSDVQVKSGSRTKARVTNKIKIHNKYKGGLVLEPARGLHYDVHIFDVTSLYPTMIIKYNLSPETVNCGCCKDDMKAKEFVTPEIMEDCEHTVSRSETSNSHANRGKVRMMGSLGTGYVNVDKDFFLKS